MARQVAAGRYGGARAQHVEELRNLAAEYDAKQTGIAAERQRLQLADSAARQAQARQGAIEAELSNLRRRNELLGVTAELDRVERLTRLGAYAEYSAAQQAELRSLAVEYDRKQKLLDLDRRRLQMRSATGDFTTGALSYAGVGFGATALGAGIAVAGAAAFSSKTAIEFERAEQSIAAVTGSMAIAQARMAELDREAERLGTSVTLLSLSWAKFEAASKGTSLEGEKARQVFLSVTEAAQKLNLRAD